MTYCVGMLLEAGLVMLADTRTNAGVDNISTYRKLHLYEDYPDRAFVIASAGSLSVTQSALTRLAAGIDYPESNGPETLEHARTMLHAAQIVGHALRQTRNEIKGSFQEEGLNFGASLLLGGRIGDGAPELYLIYSAGNFIECGPDTPYLQVGELKYGKPILDRELRHDTPLGEALKIALLSFDATIRANLAVGLPIDLALLCRGHATFTAKTRIEADDEYWSRMNRDWGAALHLARLELLPPPYLS